MKADIKQTLLRALELAKDDSLERATWAFRNCTPEQMQEVYGVSGSTRQEILDSYRAARQKVLAAMEWVNLQVTEEQ